MKAASMKPVGRSLLAVVASAAALASAVGLSAGLRRAAGGSSHQQATPEVWFEASAAISPAQLAHGRKLFLGSCAHCHGADASGDEGPDLHGIDVSDRYIANTITRGIKGEMPSFAKKLGRPDIAELTAYLRSLE
jgi:mono/diheme cytochrome c family protein